MQQVQPQQAQPLQSTAIPRGTSIKFGLGASLAFLLAILLSGLFFTSVQAQDKPSDLPNEFAETIEEGNNEFFYARVGWWSHQPSLEIQARPTAVITLTDAGIGSADILTVTSEGYQSSFYDHLEFIDIESIGFAPSVTFRYTDTAECPKGLSTSLFRINDEVSIGFRNFSNQMFYFRNPGDELALEIEHHAEPQIVDVGFSGEIIISPEDNEALECGRVIWAIPNVGEPPQVPDFTYYFPIIGGASS